MDRPRPPGPEESSDEPRWWLVSDWSGYPPESAPMSLPAIHWHAPLFDLESLPVAPSSQWEVTAVPGAGPLVPAADVEATQALFMPALDWETVATQPEPREGSRRSGVGRVPLGVKIAAAAPLMLLIAAMCTVYAFAR